jgi:hypothetical protein
MSTYKFDEEAIAHALDAAKRTHEGIQLNAAKSDFNVHHIGSLSVHAECTTVEIKDNKVCLVLPLGFGEKCLGIPANIPNGTAARACLSICTFFGAPTGVKVTVSVAGVTIVSTSYGKC